MRVLIFTFNLLINFHYLMGNINEPPYKYNLAICAIFRNEARFLKEWIEYHRIVGVDHFILYNNLSEDEYESVLEPYLRIGIVELHDWPYESFKPYEFDMHQINAYRDCLENIQGIVKWLALIDTDEFLIPIKDCKLISILEKFSDKGGITVNWVLFGTSGIKKISENKLMTESLIMKGKYRESQDTRIKSIVRPERVKWIDNAHYAHYYSSYHAVDETGREIGSQMSNPHIPMDFIRINHYWTRDEEFFLNHKLNRRVKNLGQEVEDVLQCAENLNKEIDTLILRFTEPLRERIF